MPKKKGVSIPKITQLPSGAYNCYLRIKDADGVTQNISITDDDYKVVEARAIAIKSGIIQAEKSPRQLPTLEKAIDNYIAERSNTLSPSTIRGYRRIQSGRFKAYMHRNLSVFDERLCRRMVNDEAALCGAKTLKNAWHFVSSVIYNETGKRYNVSLPPEKKVPHLFLDFEQIGTFVQAVRGLDIEITVLFALNSLRCSEIYGLSWDDVDLSKGIITISGALVADEHNRYVYKDTAKTDTSSRTIEIIIPRLLELLRTADKSQPFTCCTPPSLWRKINRICAANDLPQVGVHGLRHSFASLAYHLQIPKEIAMAIGGWENDKIMSDIYTHLAAADVNEHRERFKSFFAQIADENADALQNI